MHESLRKFNPYFIFIIALCAGKTTNGSLCSSAVFEFWELEFCVCAFRRRLRRGSWVFPAEFFFFLLEETGKSFEFSRRAIRYYSLTTVWRWYYRVWLQVPKVLDVILVGPSRTRNWAWPPWYFAKQQILTVWPSWKCTWVSVCVTPIFHCFFAAVFISSIDGRTRLQSLAANTQRAVDGVMPAGLATWANKRKGLGPVKNIDRTRGNYFHTSSERTEVPIQQETRRKLCLHFRPAPRIYPAIR